MGGALYSYILTDILAITIPHSPFTRHCVIYDCNSSGALFSCFALGLFSCEKLQHHSLRIPHP